MSCRRFRQLMHDSYDHVLSQADARSLDAHLAACPNCRAYQAEMDAILGGLDELKSLSALDLAESSPRCNRRRLLPQFLVRISGLAAAIALFVVGAWLIKPWAAQVKDPPGLVVGAPGTPELAFTPTVLLSEKTAQRFIPVVQTTDDPHVHLIWLHSVARQAEASEPTAPGSTMRKANPGQLRARGESPPELARGPVRGPANDKPVA